MADCFLLYIDILGFSALVRDETDRVLDLYEVIASLNVHRHHAFRAIVFSDTILVYNIDGGHTPADRNYLVMFLCEFAQDLQHRLTGRGIVFRATLVRGHFEHYALNSLPFLFGPALIDAYEMQKDIQAIGLFIHQSIRNDSDIFKTVDYNGIYSFVFITQSLDRIEDLYGGRFPIDRWSLEETELIYHLVPEVMYLKQLHHWMITHVDAKVRQKCLNTWDLFKARYPRTVQHLEQTNFDLEAISPGAIWDEVLSRFPEDYSWAIGQRQTYL